jgi:tRNA A-37 threonylcarbamoyl transferase component Bud32
VAQSTRIVGHYEVLEPIGRGGMAVVYRARQTHPRRLVALKELRALHDDDPSHAQRFLREADLAGALSHPCIVTVYDYFEHDGTPYIAMEYVEGGSLRSYVAGLSLPQIAGVLEGLLAGLMSAHRAGVVHRDLKPENVMVTADGQVKISDFGIAKATTQVQTGAFLTATGLTVGTPHYMAPEQAMAQQIGPWTDLYSLGCMAFELLTGAPPFGDSESPLSILMRHVNDPIPAVSSVAPSVDPDLSAWVARLLVKDPGRRTRTARTAWEELEEIVTARLGSRWRREAPLTESSLPVTPLPFPATDAVAPGPYTPPPADLPAGPLRPGPVDHDTFQPGATLPPATAPTRHQAPAKRPRRRRGLAIAAALVLGAAAGAAALASLPARGTHVSAAEARDFLDRFTASFRAEDMGRLRRLLSPTGGAYRYLANDPIPLARDYASLFRDVRVADYELSGVRISTRGREATIRARYRYANEGNLTQAGKPWLFQGTVTFHLRARPGSGLRLERVDAQPDVVLAERTSAPATTTSARITMGTKVVGSMRQRFPAGEHFVVIPLNALGRQKVRTDMKLRLTGENSPGHTWTKKRVILPYAS